MSLKRSNHFIERSIVGALSFLKNFIFADEYASKKGLLQSLDPRIKLGTFLLFIIQVMLTRNIIVLLCFYSFCLVLALLSNIGLIFFLKRTWIFMPLFSLFIAVPALFSYFTPGKPLVTLNIAAFGLTITRQGLSGACLFVMRVLTSVSFVILLSVTTKHIELLKVLRTFRIPQVFVLTLGMCYRYIFLFVEVMENTYIAVKSRVGAKIHYKKGQRLVAWNIAGLWTRSYQLNEDVYKAMLSRGYRGEPLLLDEFHVGTRDWLWLFSAVLVSVSLFFFNYSAN